MRFLSAPKPGILLLALICITFSRAFAAIPPNDSCGGALPIIISSGGYGLGSFASANTDISQATVQTGEVFAPAIFGSGLDKKSVWYRFSLLTPRAVRVTLAQPGTAITAGDVGFAVYKSNNCIPGEPEISSKLTPIGTFGNTYHPCVQPGEYLVQVSSNSKANGVIYISVEVGDAAPSPYDKPATAYQFGKPTNKVVSVDFDVECQSLDNAAENCSPATDFKDYTKSTWHTFTTPDYFDWFSVLLAEPNSGYYAPDYKIGYRIYEGDARVTPPASLTQLGGCDSMVMNGYFPEKKVYTCGQLKPNTTYTIHLLYHQDFIKQMRLAIAWNGFAVTNGNKPVNSLTAPNKMGILQTGTSGFNNTAADLLACNSRHTESNCPNSMPLTGVKYGPTNYNLSTFFSFELATSTTISISATNYCSPTILLRLYKQGLTADCNALDTSKIISTALNNTGALSCLQAGSYVLQVMGSDTVQPKSSYYYGSINTSSYPLCLKSNLGNQVNLAIYAKAEVATNEFSLAAPGKIDKLNANGAGVMQPLVPYTKYKTLADTLGCNNAVMPRDTICSASYYAPYPKAIYREFKISDSTMLEMGPRNTEQTKLYLGDANALATAQNIFNYPDSISGLKPVTKCLSYANLQYACITSGTYSLVSFDFRLGHAVSPIDVTPKTTKTRYASAATAHDMGNLWDIAPSYYDLRLAATDTFTCYDNPAVIDGQAPCNDPWNKPRNKLIYRQFYLDQPTVLSIFNFYGYPYYKTYAGVYSLFKGKATDGIGTLSAMGGRWSCFSNASSAQCDALQPGWYTIVSYGYGHTFANPLPTNTDQSHNSNVGEENGFYFTLAKACAAPKYNRPYKASIDTVTKKPYLIEWGPRTGHTAAYPITSKSYSLNTENFNCSEDTSFIRLNMKACNASSVKVAFFTFQVTQPSFVQINTHGYMASVYDFDVRTADSVKLKTDQPIQPCLDKTTKLELCQLQPGYYTLVVFATSAYSCNTITPTIYIDQVGFSRFDHAAAAYDFGVLKADSTWHNGKAGDVNPLNAGRAPSNDFFYCTTGAQEKDPGDVLCYNTYNPNIYPAGPNKPMRTDNATTPNYPDVDRRNLWYTFTIDKPGTVKIKVDNRTTGKYANNVFAVYKSDVDGSLPFATVQSNGLVDSTGPQGLTLMGANNAYCGYFSNEVSFYQEPCSFQPTRYYVLVEIKSNYHVYGYGGEPMTPNYQVEVSALLDSTNTIPPKFDHYSTANDLGLVNSGTKKGVMDNFTCATKDATDPIYAYTSCEKTLWYKFTTTVSGTVRYAAFLKNTNNYYFDQIQLLKQVKPNDSTSTGLKFLPYTTTYASNGNWAEQCISPGTYYLLLPGCAAINEDVYAQIEVIPQAGDYCSSPVIAALNGAGSKIVPVRVDCHTIGTDYGEFNNTLSCPPNATTATYKTSWYRLDIGGTDTLDVTVFINEKTNASSSEIKYRMMTGTCGAMQEQSCVLDALTQNTYKCLAPNNSYFIQVFTPVLINSYTSVTGEIDLNISAVAHADTCAPLAPCLASANFTSTFNCTTDEAVKFNNFSTYGTAIKYTWDFGYNGQGSTAVSPTFIYPALATAKDYDVKLVIENTDCARKDSVVRKITIPARPVVDFGNDSLQCNGSPVILTATSFPGATYQWQDGSTSDRFTATTKGQNQYWVKVTYNSCVSIDTINILISPVVKKAIQNFVLCAGDSILLDENRGFGETFTWNTGSTASSILVKTPGIYWVDIKYQNCSTRDSFNISSVSNATPLGKDTTICLSKGAYLLNATQAGTASYQWQDGSTQPTFNVTSGSLYWVNINFGKCSIRDSVYVSNFADPINVNTVAVICAGKTYSLPWGPVVTSAGIYRDTVRYASGCDSLITRVSLSVNPKPNLGADKPIQVCAGSFVDLTKQFVTTALTTTWTFQGAPVLTPTAVTAPGVYQLIGINSAACADTALVVLTNISKLDLGADQATSICPGTSLNLNAGFTVTGLTAAWTIAGQTVSNPLSVSNAGVYQLIANNGAGCADTALLTLSIDPKPVLGENKALPFCPGFSTDLTGLYATTGFTTIWTYGGSVATNPTLVSQAGNYTLVVVNSAGCSDTAEVILNQLTKPALGPDTAVAICPGTSIDLNEIIKWSGLSREWSLNGSPVTNSTAATSAGTYQLIATFNTGCADTALLTVTVSPKPTLGPDTAVAICSGNSLDLTPYFTNTGLPGTWKFNGTLVSNPAAVTTAGTYSYTVANSAGCSDTALLVLTVNTKPSLGADKAVKICVTEVIDLTKLFTTTGLTFSWTRDGIPVLSPSTISQGGTYQLVAASSAGCSDTAIVDIAIDPKPTLGVDKSLSVCAGEQLDLTKEFVTSGLTSNWSKDNIAISSPVAIGTAGIYRLIVTNGTGCMDTALVTVTVNAKPALGADKSVSYCPGFSADLTSIYNTAGLTVNWTKNGIAVTNPASVTAGSYRLIVYTALGCSDTALVTITQNLKPALGPDQSDSICPGEFVNLLTKYNAVGLSATWSFNNVGVSDPIAVSAPGVYRLIVENEDGCSDTAFLTLSIYTKPALGSDHSVTVCSGTLVDLTKEFSTSGLTTRWTLNGIQVSSPGAVTTGGVYQLIATNSSGCHDTANVTVILNAKPNLGSDKQVSVCVGFAADLTKEFNTNNLSPQWSLGGNPVTNPTNITTAGVYQVIVTNALGCRDTALVTLRINQNPTAKITDPAPVCAPATADLTLASVTSGSTPSLSFSYWKNSATSDGLTNASVTPAGTYFIKGTDVNGCVDVKPVKVIVYPAPVVSAGRDTTVCNQGTALLSAVAGNLSGGTVKYAWTPEPGLDDPMNSSTIARPAGSQTYTVTATVDYGVCQLTATDTKRVTMQAPVAAFAGNDTVAVKGTPLQLSASGGSSYLWSPSAPLNNAFTKSPVAILQQTTRFTVTVRDGFGCAGTDTMLVRVYDGVTYFVPNAFSPNGDGLNDVFRPIPAGIATTQWFRIFNRYGELVFETSQTMKGWDGTFKGIKQAIGNYIWAIRGKGSDGKTIEMKGNVVLVR